MRNLRRRVLGIESSQELGYATSAERNEDPEQEYHTESPHQ